MKLFKSCITFLLFAVTFQSICNAEQWEYELTDLFKVTEQNGKKKYGFSLEILNYFIQKIEVHAGRYPPSFKDDNEKVFITGKLQHLIEVLKKLDYKKINDPDFLCLYGQALAMGHNLDFNNSGVEADRIFKRALSIAPNHILANYYYGEHLYQSGRTIKSIPYLKKSIKNGMNGAKFDLAMIYLLDKKTHSETKRLLEEYIKDFNVPENHPVQELLKNLKKGNLKIVKSLDINGKKSEEIIE